MGKPMTAEQVIELKRKLKAELKRRDGIGSVASLADDKYDFLEEPEYGKPMTAEQGAKIIDLLIQICDYKDLKYVVRGEPIPEAFGEELIDFVDKLSKEEKTGEPDERTSCTGLCTGLCTGSCTGFCNGCTGTSKATTEIKRQSIGASENT